MTAHSPSRRTVLTTGVAVAGTTAGAVALAACGSGDSGSSGNGQGSGSTAAPSPAAQPGTTVAALSQVPVGGAASVEINGRPAIVARPSDTTAACFSAICTHQGCTVAPDGGSLNCPCHGSVFNALTGAVERGPAQEALPAIAVKVDGANIVTA